MHVKLHQDVSRHGTICNTWQLADLPCVMVSFGQPLPHQPWDKRRDLIQFVWTLNLSMLFSRLPGIVIFKSIMPLSHTKKAWYVNVCHTKNCFHHISSVLYFIAFHIPHILLGSQPPPDSIHGPRRLTWPRRSWRRCGPTWWSTRVRPARWAAPPPPTAAAAPSGGPWWREHRCWRRCGWDGQWLGCLGCLGWWVSIVCEWFQGDYVWWFILFLYTSARYIYKYHFLGSSVFRRPLFHVVLPAVSTLLEVSISPK